MLVSPVPDEYGTAAAINQIAAQRYRVTLPYSNDEAAPRLLYFTAHDDQGYSTYRDSQGYIQGQAAAWIGKTTEDELTDIMKRLRRRIVDNKVGIEARLREIEPNITLKQIVWGMGEKIESYPSIEINQAALRETYEGTDYFRLVSAEAQLFGYIVHQIPTIEAELVSAFGRAVQKILNQKSYEQMTLANGQVLTRCQAQNLAFDNNIWDGQRFVSSWSLDWSGEFGETLP